MKRILFKSLSTPVGFGLLEICILSADYPAFMNKKLHSKSLVSDFLECSLNLKNFIFYLLYQKVL